MESVAEKQVGRAVVRTKSAFVAADVKACVVGVTLGAVPVGVVHEHRLPLLAVVADPVMAFDLDFYVPVVTISRIGVPQVPAPLERTVVLLGGVEPVLAPFEGDSCRTLRPQALPGGSKRRTRSGDEDPRRDQTRYCLVHTPPLNKPHLPY